MKTPKVLLIEDDESALFGYERYLSKTGYATQSALNIGEAKRILTTDRFDAVVLDLKLPDGDGINLLPELKNGHPNTPVIVITGDSDIATAVKATKFGAEDFLTKPVDMNELKITLVRCLEIGALRKRSQIQQRLENKGDPYFGNSKAIATILDHAKVAAANDTVLLLLGETGTGKGVLARWIHDQGDRKSEAFVELNCSSLRGELLRSELFGHVKGAFTTAIKDREGLIEVAHGGTLFLDEIGDMDIEVQSQLLKTIEEKSFRRLGENLLRTSDFRLICATNRDLFKETDLGRFRKDLYYRICVFPIAIPPLRERKSDIPGLCEYILQGFGYSLLPLASDVLDVLIDYSWPGNIRELRNMLERALLLARGKPVSLNHFPGLPVYTVNSYTVTNSNSLEEVERVHILKVIKECNDDKYKASEALGISLSSLYRKLSRIKVET